MPRAESNAWRTEGFAVYATRASGTSNSFVLNLMRRARRGKGKAAGPKLMRSDNSAYNLGHTWPSAEAAMHPRNV